MEEIHVVRQRLNRRHIRKLGKTGNSSSPSYYVTLPINIVRALNWRDGQKIVIKKSRNKVVIEDLEV